MAMNKKEQAEFEALKKQAAINRALRWTDEVDFDVVPPGFDEKLGSVRKGWLFNVHRAEAMQAWTKLVSHGYGEYVEGSRQSASQNSRRMYSTEELALKAMRNAMEREFAERLAKVDARLAEIREAAK